MKTAPATKPKTYHEGARAERSAFIAKLRREVKATKDSNKVWAAAYCWLLTWALDRRKRYEARPGGLGRAAKP
jgi:hypothetical protein